MVHFCYADAAAQQNEAFLLWPAEVITGPFLTQLRTDAAN